MSEAYSLTFVNGYAATKPFCSFVSPATPDPAKASPPWHAAQVATKEKRAFGWTSDRGWVWGGTGRLPADVVFNATQTVAGKSDGVISFACAYGTASAGAAIVAQASPNLSNLFSDPVKIRAATRDFKPGEALDQSRTANKAQIVFPSGVYTMTATLKDDGTLAAAPTG